MSNRMILKLMTIVGLFFSTISLKAQVSEVYKVTDEDVKNLQNLVDKKILTINQNGLNLNQELINMDLIDQIQSVKVTNCTNGGGGL